MTNPQVLPGTALYVFILDDHGLIKQILADNDLSRLAVSAMSSVDAYLNTFGYRETKDGTPTTEDGFAQIYRAKCGETQTAGTIWTYEFDGEQTLVEAGDRLDKVIKEMEASGMVRNAPEYPS